MKKYRVHLNPNGCVDVIGEPRIEHGDGELAFYQKDSDIETAYFKPPYWRHFHLVEDEKGEKPDFTELESSTESDLLIFLNGDEAKVIRCDSFSFGNDSVDVSLGDRNDEFWGWRVIIWLFETGYKIVSIHKDATGVQLKTALQMADNWLFNMSMVELSKQWS